MMRELKATVLLPDVSLSVPLFWVFISLVSFFFCFFCFCLFHISLSPNCLVHSWVLLCPAKHSKPLVTAFWSILSSWKCSLSFYFFYFFIICGSLCPVLFLGVSLWCVFAVSVFSPLSLIQSVFACRWQVEQEMSLYGTFQSLHTSLVKKPQNILLNSFLQIVL